MSESWKLAGSGNGGSSKCAPQQYVNGGPDPSLPHNGEINPCGLIAWSFFNDSYTAAVVGPGGAPVPLELDVSGPHHLLFLCSCMGTACNWSTEWVWRLSKWSSK